MVETTRQQDSGGAGQAVIPAKAGIQGPEQASSSSRPQGSWLAAIVATLLLPLSAPAAEAGGAIPLAVDGSALRIEETTNATRIEVRASREAPWNELASLEGTRPVSCFGVDLQGDGRPEQLVVVEEPGSGAYRTFLLVSEDGGRELWRSGPMSGAEASPGSQGRTVRIRSIREGEQPEGDLSIERTLRLDEKGPRLGPARPADAENGWQQLTAGDLALEQGDWEEAVRRFTLAVDSTEGSGAELGPRARLLLARALLLTGNAVKARSILAGGLNRFPASPLVPELRRWHALFDLTQRHRHKTLQHLVRAQELLARERPAEAAGEAEKLLDAGEESGLADRAHFYLGRAFQDLGESRKAVSQYQKVVLYYAASPLASLAQEELTRLELGRGQ